MVAAGIVRCTTIRTGLAPSLDHSCKDLFLVIFLSADEYEKTLVVQDSIGQRSKQGPGLLARVYQPSDP